MDAIYTVTEPGQLRALSDPLRLRILEELIDAPRTSAQLSALLDQPLNKLHYHLMQLERHGLVTLVETRQKGNLVEKYYRAIARYIRVDRTIAARHPQALSLMTQGTVHVLNLALQDYVQSVQNGLIGAEEIASAMVVRRKLALTQDQVEAFRRRLQALIEEFQALETPEAPAKPEITAKVKAMISGFVGGHLDLSLFTADLVSGLTAEAKSGMSDALRSPGAIQSIALVERHSNGDKRKYRYRVTYPKDSLFFLCAFNQDNKVTGFGIQPE